MTCACATPSTWPGPTSIALVIALIVQETSRWNNFLRAAILVPSALGLASASLLFYGLYSPNIGPLSERFRVIAVDMPGWGESDPQTDETGRDHVAVLVELLEALGIEQAALVVL